MRPRESHPYPAVVLAAGESSRMGVPKQLLPYRGTHLLGHAITCASLAGFTPIYVVLGCRAHLIESNLRLYQVHVVLNREWREGMASSVRSGVAAVLSRMPECPALLILLCDQPRFHSSHFRHLQTGWERSPELVAAATLYPPGLGAPALIGSKLFPELLALSGDAGARAILQKHAASVAVVPAPNAEGDVDTPEEYRRLIEKQFSLRE